MKVSLSVIILTLNEEENIANCLFSVKWADEIIIIDSGSTDNTIKIASKYTDKIITRKDTYANNRNYGFEIAKNNWLFWLDADEIVTKELRDELTDAVIENKEQGYKINRKTFFITKFIKYAGWYPDSKLRLFRKNSGTRFENKSVHENLIYDFNAPLLKNDILHYTDRTFEHYVSKMNKYTDLAAFDLSKNNVKSGFFDIFVKPFFSFIKMYFLKLGFLDGYIGLILCLLSSVSVHIKYSKLYFINNNGR